MRSVVHLRSLLQPIARSHVGTFWICLVSNYITTLWQIRESKLLRCRFVRTYHKITVFILQCLIGSIFVCPFGVPITTDLHFPSGQNSWRLFAASLGPGLSALELPATRPAKKSREERHPIGPMRCKASREMIGIVEARNRF